MTEEPRMVGMDGRPAGIRSFSMNSPEAHQAMCEPGRRHNWGTPVIMPGGAERIPETVWVRGGSEEEGEGAFRSWLRHVEAGRIG